MRSIADGAWNSKAKAGSDIAGRGRPRPSAPARDLRAAQGQVVMIGGASAQLSLKFAPTLKRSSVLLIELWVAFGPTQPVQEMFTLLEEK
jgi:hypothetical protein